MDHPSNPHSPPGFSKFGGEGFTSSRRPHLSLCSSIIVTTFCFFSLILSTTTLSQADLVFPRPGLPQDRSKPTPVTFRIINQENRPLFLQGVRDNQERLVVNLFLLGNTRGWQSYLDYLPCDLPQCHEMGTLREKCPKGDPFPIRLGPVGTSGAVYELFWEGRLYVRTEALNVRKRGQYCYKSFVPKKGTIHIEIEYSKTLSANKAYPGRIGARERSAIEFSLPPAQPIMVITVPSEQIGRHAPKALPQ